MSDPCDDRAPSTHERDRRVERDESPETRDANAQGGSGSDETNDGNGVDGPDESGPTDSVEREGRSSAQGVNRQSGDDGQSQASERRPTPTRSNRSGSRAPPRKRGSTDSDSRVGRVLQYGFDIGSSVVIVVLIGALLFATSGVWPPLVAIESGSMEPHIDTGDLVFVMDEHRFAGSGAIGESGVVTAQAGKKTGYRTFSGYGDVIVYEPNGNENATPIIHRAMFWVENNERWYDEADPSAIGGADNCKELAYCPAPHAGFITKGDNNRYYDQVGNQFSAPVKPEWVIGTAEYRVPGLGQVRLLSGEVRSTNVTTSTNVTAGTNTTSVDVPAIVP
ncbi:MAG: S26 family signal peptidase [Halorhabdus sp.]